MEIRSRATDFRLKTWTLLREHQAEHLYRLCVASVASPGKRLFQRSFFYRNLS